MKSNISCKVTWIRVSVVTMQNKTTEVDISQFGKSDCPFTCQMRHFAAIWRNSNRQRESCI